MLPAKIEKRAAPTTILDEEERALIRARLLTYAEEQPLKPESLCKKMADNAVRLGGAWLNSAGGISFPAFGGQVTIWPITDKDDKAS